jgi:hypothetical protein
MMANQDISTDKRRQRKILDRLAMVNVHSKVQEGIRSEQVNLARERPLPLPFLFQG